MSRRIISGLFLFSLLLGGLCVSAVGHADDEAERAIVDHLTAIVERNRTSGIPPSPRLLGRREIEDNLREQSIKSGEAIRRIQTATSQTEKIEAIQDLRECYLTSLILVDALTPKTAVGGSKETRISKTLRIVGALFQTIFLPIVHFDSKASLLWQALAATKIVLEEYPGSRLSKALHSNQYEAALIKELSVFIFWLANPVGEQSSQIAKHFQAFDPKNSKRYEGRVNKLFQRYYLSRIKGLGGFRRAVKLRRLLELAHLSPQTGDDCTNLVGVHSFAVDAVRKWRNSGFKELPNAR